jgi:hypothetical protein
LVTTVDKLLKMILEHPDADVRAGRLIILHDALEAAAIIGGCLKTPAAGRQRTAAAEEAKLVDSRRRDEILVEVARSIKRKYPTWKRWRIAGEGLEQTNKLLKAQGLETLVRDSLFRHLGRLWPRIVSSLEDQPTPD